jgi:KUP system potassium uptake protein
MSASEQDSSSPKEESAERTAERVAEEAAHGADHGHGHGTGGRRELVLLAYATLGVVYGDIGTSPLYALREGIHALGGAQASQDDVLGLLSLIFWSLVGVVAIKYCIYVMRADNKGEGGIFALLALIPPAKRQTSTRGVGIVAGLAVVGAALLYSDGVITPAISVLSAVEGLELAQPQLHAWVIPITLTVIVALFAVQRRGTKLIGRFFGPIMTVWFTTIGALGVYHIVQNPSVLSALSPHHAAWYFVRHGFPGIAILGSVVLAVTGGEALYADMGHLGLRPIRAAWFSFVMPALVLAYFGEGALVLRDPTALENPFFSMVPRGNWTLALVLLASAATVIASQALISGAFSLTRQAMQLGFFPRMTIAHTDSVMEGQIYIPELNWLLAAGCCALVVSFHESAALAAAYGLAVTGTMTITTVLYYVVARTTWGWSRSKAVPILIAFLIMDLAFLSANALKFKEGGYVPVLMALMLTGTMLIWNRGRALLVARYVKKYPRFEVAKSILSPNIAARVPGVAVFMASSAEHVPPVLVHHVERSRSLHKSVLLLTVETAPVPFVDAAIRTRVETLEMGFYRVTVSYGYMEQPNVIEALEKAVADGMLPLEPTLDPRRATYYLGRENIVGTGAGEMGMLAERYYGFLQRNAASADRHFGIPFKQVVELGTQLDL